MEKVAAKLEADRYYKGRFRQTAKKTGREEPGLSHQQEREREQQPEGKVSASDSSVRGVLSLPGSLVQLEFRRAAGAPALVGRFVRSLLLPWFCLYSVSVV